MRVLVLTFLLAATVFAGCSDNSAPILEDDDGIGLDVTVDDSTGAIRGVVVDQAIRPVPEATVTLRLEAGDKTTTTDDVGAFKFEGLEGGLYILVVSKPGYTTTQGNAEVVVGDADPPMIKLQIERLFEQDPYVTSFKFQGFINCGYSLPFISSPCITDYTVLVCNGGCVNDLRQFEGTRRYETTVDAGWQTHIVEMQWEPSATGTAESFGVTIGPPNRTASDWYASGGGPSPNRLQIDVGVVHPSQQGAYDKIPEDGGDLVGIINPRNGVAVNQDFELFAHTFYYAPAPEGWAFLQGDEIPF